MDTEHRKTSKTRRRRRLQAPRRRFQASFLHSSATNTSVSAPSEPRSTSPLPSRPDPDPLARDTLVRLRYRSPVAPIDYRSKFSRIPEELHFNSILVRQTLRQASANGGRSAQIFKTADSAESEEALPKVETPQFLVSGLSKAISVKSRHDSPAPMRPKSESSQGVFHYDGNRRMHSELRPTDHFPLKYFNSEVIPKKPERTVTLSDIQKYLKYIGTRPFK